MQPDPNKKQFVHVGVPITGLTVEAIGGSAKDKGKNIFVLGLLARIFHLDTDKLKKLIAERFSGKSGDVANTALDGLPGRLCLSGRQRAFPALPVRAGRGICDGRAQVTMDGNQALAYGLIAAGVRYGAGYPITPWSSDHGNSAQRIAEIRRHLCAGRGRTRRGLDGARLFLRRPSGGDGQRRAGHFAEDGGDRLGVDGGDAAHRHQRPARRPEHRPADQRRAERLYQAIFGGHGDSPRVVLAAATVEDCFYIAIEAARIARKYSTPVIILSDSSLATRIEAFDEPDLKKLMQDPKPDLTPRARATSPTRSTHVTQACSARDPHAGRKISRGHRPRAR